MSGNQEITYALDFRARGPGHGENKMLSGDGRRARAQRRRAASRRRTRNHRTCRAYACRHRRTLHLSHAPYWFSLLITFFIFSLGPWLHVAGHVTPIPGPYHLLELLIPPLKLGGVPMRTGGRDRPLSRAAPAA